MRFQVHCRYIEISIKEDNPFLDKILFQIKKHFSQIHKLSSTLLILDDEKKIKKQYFLNWLIHLQESCDKALLDELMEKSNLPIRIKIFSPQSLIHQIDIKARYLKTGLIKIVLSNNDLKAKRCVMKIFEHYMIASSEILLDSSKDGFWEYFMSLIDKRVVGNCVLNFDFENKDYLTEAERELEEHYWVLDSQIGDSIEQVRKNYLKLVKKYHPDNVFGADYSVIRWYQKRFLRIQNAFKRVCANLY